MNTGNGLRISRERYEDLSAVEKENASNNGCGSADASYLRVEHNGKLISLESDAMEPEDCRFYRDLKWVQRLLQQVYDLGFKEGFNSCKDNDGSDS